MRTMRDTTIKERPNITKRNNVGSLTYSITDMDIFKGAINVILELIKDERISKDVRYEYFDKLAKVINIKDYHIEL